MLEKLKLSSILDSKTTKSVNVNKILYLKTEIFQTKTITTFRHNFNFNFNWKDTSHRYWQRKKVTMTEIKKTLLDIKTRNTKTSKPNSKN